MLSAKSLQFMTLNQRIKPLIGGSEGLVHNEAYSHYKTIAS